MIGQQRFEENERDGLPSQSVWLQFFTTIQWLMFVTTQFRTEYLSLTLH